MRRLLMAPLAVSLLFLAGCKNETEQAQNLAGAEQEAVAVPEYSAKHGILLPEETRRSIGLKVVETTEQKIAATLPIELKVFHLRDKIAMATALVTPEKAKTIEPGQKVKVRSEQVASEGTIKAVHEKVRQATGMIEILVELPEPPANIELGTFLKGEVQTGSDRDAITIPRSALLESADGDFVYTVSGDHFVRTAVTTGAKNEEWVEITDGLYAGDEVAAQPVMSLWMTELAAVKGGQACCLTPPKGK